jgi:hypothetical protein
MADAMALCTIDIGVCDRADLQVQEFCFIQGYWGLYTNIPSATGTDHGCGALYTTCFSCRTPYSQATGANGLRLQRFRCRGFFAPRGTGAGALLYCAQGYGLYRCTGLYVSGATAGARAFSTQGYMHGLLYPIVQVQGLSVSRATEQGP